VIPLETHQRYPVGEMASGHQVPPDQRLATRSAAEPKCDRREAVSEAEGIHHLQMHPRLRRNAEMSITRDQPTTKPPNFCCSECAGCVLVSIRGSWWRIAEHFRWAGT
jgi:hypothetical protein